jgi:serine/threonine protein phosphatase 1
MIYAVGDIHGMASMLDPALAKLAELLHPSDAVVFLGDYIDRGPDSEGVLKRLVRFRKQHQATVFLRGNHEDLLLRSMQGDRRREEMWLFSGGMTTLASFGLGGNSDWKKKFPKWALEFIATTQVAVKTEQYHFVHAGVVPFGVDTEVEPDLDPRLWIREPFIRYGNSPGRIVVFGHTPQTDHRPLVHTNKVGLDTGACQGGTLSIGGFDDIAPRHRMPEFLLFQVRQDRSVTPIEKISNVLTHVPEAMPTHYTIPSLT